MRRSLRLAFDLGKFRKLQSHVMLGLCVAACAAVVGVLVLVTTYLTSIGIGSLSLDFFTRIPSGGVTDPGGMKHALVGTLILLVLASIIGVPMGVLCGIFLSEYGRSRLASPVRFTADVLAGVPSIVVGILGYELLVVPIGHYNGYAGAAALAFIMVPIVSRTTEEMLRLVPKSYREGSLALGATKAQTILKVVLPSMSGSIITGVMLALARVAGETAPLLFTALGSRFLETDPGRPFPSLTVQIYTYATGPYPKQRDLAWSGILVLIALLFIINVSVRAVMARTVRART
jgi:phosphate transport system permease protein